MNGDDKTLSREESFKAGSLSVSDLAVSAGFAIMLAWHYLVLFTVVIDEPQGASGTGYLFYRQLALYAALAVSFGIIGALNLARLRRGRRFEPTLPILYGMTFLAMGASALCALAPLSGAAEFAAIALLGVSEALLMFSWLNRFAFLHRSSLLHSFSIDMIAGGLIALLICLLKWPSSTIISIALPGISALALIWDTRQRHARRCAVPARENAADNPDTPPQGDDALPKFDARSDTQECADPSEADAENAPFFPKRANLPKYLMLSVGIYSFTFGLVQGSFFSGGIPLLVADDAVVLLGIALAGIIIFETPEHIGRGVSVDLMHRFSLLLFALGSVGIAWYDLGPAFQTLSQVAILAGFNLFDFGVMAYGMNKRGYTIGPVRVLEGGRPIVYTSLALGLVLGYAVLQAIPAEDAHMSLVMVCGAAIALLVVTTILPFYSLDSAIEGTHATDDRSEHPTEKEPANIVELLAQASAEALTGKDAMQENWVSPWRSSCTQIAKLYQLSPRETEIFLLIAKGRNAEYVQQKLVISTHTAKTHIANIYRKLEVHSQQELLDLIEAFRDADRRLSEADDEQA